MPRADLSAGYCSVLQCNLTSRLGSSKLRDGGTLLIMYDGSVKRSLGLCIVVVKDVEAKSR